MKTSFHIGLLLIGLSAEIVSGQDYVLLANGESFKGEIISFNQSVIGIRPDSQDKVQKLTADQINYMLKGSDAYYSKKIIAINTKNGATISQLVRMSSWGKIRVYAHNAGYNRYSIVNYYLEKDDSGLILIGTTSINRYHDKVMLAEIAEAVSNLFSDNSDLKARFLIDKKIEKRKVILRYVREYNQGYQKALK